ncbi:hypothetical protein OG21DRAFT_1386286, partial [Imleria badia]
TVKWTRTQLFLRSLMHEHRCVNIWNAFLKEKLKEVNSGCEKGDRFKLLLFIAKYKSELLDEYRKLSPVHKQTLIAKVQAACDSKVPSARANPKAVNQAITATFANMDHEVPLCAKTGMEGFFIAVRGTVKDHTEPKRPMNRIISDCCNIIQEGLNNILTEHGVTRNVKMNYTNYELHIVE